jgi:hypothetical protein
VQQGVLLGLVLGLVLGLLLRGGQPPAGKVVQQGVLLGLVLGLLLGVLLGQWRRHAPQGKLLQRQSLCLGHKAREQEAPRAQ